MGADTLIGSAAPSGTRENETVHHRAPVYKSAFWKACNLGQVRSCFVSLMPP